MQSKEELENWYETPDPWDYENTHDDFERKVRILGSLHGRFKRALDIGAGEGFITRDLPADEVFAYEISDNASTRLPEGIKRVLEPEGKYDLIIACGVLYPQYDFDMMLDLIRKHASGIVLTCNIKNWEINDLDRSKIIHEEVFQYREYTEHLVVYNFETTS